MATAVYPSALDGATRDRVAEVLSYWTSSKHVSPNQITELIVAVTRGLPVYPALAMCGEAGEAAEKIKKAWRDGGKLDVTGVLRELGDVLWYITAIANDMGCTLQQVAEENIAKLKDRRARNTIHGSGDNR